MSLTSLSAHIDRDTRRQNRAAAGSLMARSYTTPDLSYVGASTIVYGACIKPRGLSIPEGVVVVAVRRDGTFCHPVMVEAFEGDRAGFASFPRLAHMLGATELHLITKPSTMLARIRAQQDLRHCAAADRAALLARPLVIAGAFDRAAIMATACAVAKARQTMTGETWGVCLSAALKGVWILAKAARLAAAH